MELTNRVEEWELNQVSCVLCGDELGWAEGFPEMWCDHCAKMPTSAEELDNATMPE